MNLFTSVILIYTLIAIILMVVGGIFELRYNGYVEHSFIMGLAWPISLPVILALLFMSKVGDLFEFLTDCLEVITIKIARILRISLLYEDENKTVCPEEEK